MDTKNKNTQEPKFEITKDNILHYFMHAATREDIAELRAENKANIDSLRAEFKSDISRLDDKIERIADKMDVKFSALSDKLDKKLNKHFMWLVGLMFSGFAGTMVFIVKYLPLVINK